MDDHMSRAVISAVCVLTSAVNWAAAQTPSNPIQHIVIIMQENRSFDSYFGTFPGANGIPANTCVPLNPKSPSAGCVVPFHDQHDVNTGGPHAYASAVADIDSGAQGIKMDGFIAQQAISGHCSSSAVTVGGLTSPLAAECSKGIAGVKRNDAVGYHTAAEIPNYWTYASQFVLQDSMFESVRSWSLDSHLYLVSEWAAICDSRTNPTLSSCQTAHSPGARKNETDTYPWVNLFQLMDTNNVSWKYYLSNGQEPDCDDGEMTCEPKLQHGQVLSIWNPAPGFAWVQQQGSGYLAAHNPNVDQFLVDVKSGTLPQVSWVIPNAPFSEHPTGGVTAGMEYVTSLVNAVMQSPYWQNTAIFIAWDDWGGFYDHVVPPTVDTTSAGQAQGFGLRVPGLMISAYARAGMIDHAVLSFDSYAVLVEQLFMGGAHLDPVAMGQPDNRPDVRDALTSVSFPNGTTAPIGRLIDEFDFTQAPLPPVVLSTHIPTGIAVACGSKDPANNPQNCVGANVTVSWQPVTQSKVPGPFTYNVLRDGRGSPVCSTTSIKCVDTGAPSGVHFYTAYSLDAAQTASPPSAGAEADVP